MTTSTATTTPSQDAPSRSKTQPRRPVRPDFDARDALVQKIQAKISEFQKDATRLKTKLDDLMIEGRANGRLEELKRALTNTVHSREQLQKLRDVAKKRLQEVDAAPSVKAPVKKGVDANTNADSIRVAMEKLQQKVAVEADPAERDKLILRLQALNNSYKQLTEAGGAQGAPGDISVLKAKLKTELDGYSEQLKEVQSRESEQRGKLDELRSQMNASQPDIDKLRAEREQCFEVVRKLRDEISKIQDDYQQQFDKFKADKVAWDAFHQERQAERAEERKQREEHRAKQEMENRGPPFSIEIMRCDQLMQWSKQYTQAREQTAASAPVAAPDAFDGMQVARSKKAEDDDDLFATATRSKSKKKNARKGSAGSERKPESQKVQLDMETLALFSKLRLPVPSTVGDMPELVNKVEQKKAEYEDKQKRALAGEKVEDAAEGEPSVPSKAKAKQGGAKGMVSVSMRCDEAFGSVLIELTAH